ncbi:MAG: cation diffusion facilitator family transporter [Bacteroidetes bacterium]|nr:cation diffusion facilitator family transporter [Bacteroidota bacterium]
MSDTHSHDDTPEPAPEHSPSGAGPHGGHRHGRDASTTRLVLAVVFNFLITVAEFVAGFVAGSLALLADAAHNLNDTASMGIALAARKISTRAADRRRTFGYERAELIGAFINLTTLVLIALYLLVEAVRRFFEPQSIDGTLMLIVGAITLGANVATAFVLYKPSKGSLNIRSAFVHIVADALGSVAVIVGGWVIMQYNWTVVDPILTIAIAVYILVQSYGLLRETISILMESAPKDFPLAEMIRSIERVEHVQDVHHVHVWRLSEHETALEAHVVVEGISELRALDALKADIKQHLRDAFGIGHATLEVEHEACTDPPTRTDSAPSAVHAHEGAPSGSGVGQRGRR